MDGLISRQAVLNLCDMRDKYKIPYEYDDGSKHIKGYDEGRIINVTKLKMLPSVKPQTGHWIEYTRVLMPEPINRWEQAWYCSECKYGNQECEDGSAWLEWKYCPNCGCGMVEPQ
jgi:hypothetical protein